MSPVTGTVAELIMLRVFLDNSPCQKTLQQGTIHCILDILHTSTYKYSIHIDTHCGQTYLDMLTLLQLLMLKDDAQDSKVLVPFPSGITNT